MGSISKMLRMWQVVVLVFGLMGSVLSHSVIAASANQTTPINLSADLRCASGGGAVITCTIRNLSQRTLEIKDDFHLLLRAVKLRGQALRSEVFVFPAPGFDVIAPGAEQTSIVPMGTAEAGEPEVDLHALRLILEAQVWFEGQNRAITRYFSFPGCPSGS